MNPTQFKNYFLSAILMVLASLAGLYFPDTDFYFAKLPILQNMYLIQHRSAITHSVLLAWLIWAAAKGNYSSQIISSQLKVIAVGVAVGLAVHLSFDLFPRAWRGGALIYFPLIGNLSWIPADGDLIAKTTSIIWLFCSIVSCWTIIWNFVRTMPTYLSGSIIMLMVGTFMYASLKEQHFWFPLCVLAGAGLSFLLTPALKSLVRKT